jgi:hypothetical protein
MSLHNHTPSREKGRPRRLPFMPPAASSRPRFRPSSNALSGTRPYQRPSPSKNAAATSVAATLAISATLAPGRLPRSRKRWATPDGRGGRFIRRHCNGRLATHACELTLLHLAHAFAVEAGRAAFNEASKRTRSSSSNSSSLANSSCTEEGDMRKALAKLLGPVPPSNGNAGPTVHSAGAQLVVGTVGYGGRGGKGKATPAPLHPLLLSEPMSSSSNRPSG